MDIKFIKDSTAKDKARTFREIESIISKNSRDERRRDFGTKFMHSLMTAAHTIKHKDDPKETPRIQLHHQNKFIQQNQIMQPKFSKPEIKHKEKHKKSFSPENYTLLLANNKPLIKASISKDDFGKKTYNLVEPKIDKKLIDFVRKNISFRFTLNKKILENNEYLIKKIKKAAKKLKISYDDILLDGVKYYLFRDMINLGKIDSLFHDHRIKQITCDGENKALIIDHNQFGKINSNIVLKKEEIANIIEKIAEKKKEKVTKKTQSLNLLIDGFRFKATLGSGLSPSKFILTREIP